LLADQGLNEVEIMAVTGHKNSKSLKVYVVANSKIQKLKSANAIALGGATAAVSSSIASI